MRVRPRAAAINAIASPMDGSRRIGRGADASVPVRRRVSSRLGISVSQFHGQPPQNAEIVYRVKRTPLSNSGPAFASAATREGKEQTPMRNYRNLVGRTVC